MGHKTSLFSIKTNTKGKRLQGELIDLCGCNSEPLIGRVVEHNRVGSWVDLRSENDIERQFIRWIGLILVGTKTKTTDHGNYADLQVKIWVVDGSMHGLLTDLHVGCRRIYSWTDLCMDGSAVEFKWFVNEN